MRYGDEPVRACNCRIGLTLCKCAMGPITPSERVKVTMMRYPEWLCPAKQARVYAEISDQRPEWKDAALAQLESDAVQQRMTLPADSAARKNVPVLSGCINYFPAALAGVAKHSKAGNDKHNPGEELHHARGKSSDHGDCIVRHLMDIQDYLAVLDRKHVSTCTPEDVRLRILDEANALCWRALALSQELHEEFAGSPLAPGARLP